MIKMIYYQELVCFKYNSFCEIKTKFEYLGEIVLWDEKDQGGYTIDNQGEWEKIDGQQWFGNNIFKTFNKTALTKR